MSEDDFQSVLVFILPWAGFPIGALLASIRRQYLTQQRRIRLAKMRKLAAG
jgi:hypothetical protein